MYYLGIDTTSKYLIVSIFNDDEVLYFYQEEANRNVSENLNLEIDKAFKEINIKPKDLNAIVVTRGPGSFTGVRIGLSVAKVLAMILNIDLYSVSSNDYYSGNTLLPVILDARSKKVFYGKYTDGILSEEIIAIEDLEELVSVKGEGSLIGLSDDFSNLDNNFLLIRDKWRKESALDAVPTYLKRNI